MINVLQFSGGRTSAFMLRDYIDTMGRAPDYVLFENTGREMPETYDFVRDIELNWGVDITWLEFQSEPPFFKVVNFSTASRNGEPFADLIKMRGYPPNVVTRYCSDVLKYRTAKKYLLSQGHIKWNYFIGLRADECKRVVRIKNSKHSREIIHTPLADKGFTKNHVLDFWEKSGFDLKLENINGKTPLGNCDGCFLKSERNLINLCKRYPERADWWIEQERIYNKTFVKDRKYSDLKAFASQPDLFEAAEKYNALCDNAHGVCETF